MNADEALGMGGDRGEPGDRDRRRVGGDDRLGLEEGAQVGEDLALDVLVLRRRLDHEVAIGEIVVIGGDADAVERRLALGFVELALGD